MKLYTKTGDRGQTTLYNGQKVSKTDERIELLGTLDELTSQIGLCKVQANNPIKECLSIVQQNLMRIMAYAAGAHKSENKISEQDVELLEEWIDSTEAKFTRQHSFALPGGCEASARFDVARTVARRAERRFCRVAQLHSADPQAQRYVNRISDYLYICARYADFENANPIDQDSEVLKQRIVAEVLKQINQIEN